LIERTVSVMSIFFRRSLI